MILYDTETTGLPGAIAMPALKQPFIIELCILKLDDKTLKETDCFDELLNTPGRPPVSAEVTKITGIKEDDLKGKLPFIAHLPRIIELFLGEETSAAHNHDFDSKLLELELVRLDKVTRFPWPHRRICTVEKTVFIKGHKIKLGEAYEHATGQKLSGAHRAINDTRAMADVIRWLRKKGKV